MKKIVIIGGGFAGVYATKHLLKRLRKEDVEIIMISEQNFFLFTPMLHEVATGGISKENIIQPLKRIFRSKQFSLMKAKALSVNTREKIVNTTLGNVSYDLLVLATGSKINFHNVKGAAEYSLPLRTLHDAFAIKNRIIRQIELAEETKDETQRKKLLSFAIVGGGPTGVELAGELAEFLKIMLCSHYKRVKHEEINIILLHRGQEILNMLQYYYQKRCRKRLGELGIEVQTSTGIIEVGKEYVIDDKHQRRDFGTIFWTAGFASQTVYAVGDCACLEIDGQRIPMLAQLAVQQSEVLAHNVAYALGFEDKPKMYKYKLTGFLLSVGQYFGVAGIKKVYFSGFFAWWLWRTIYLSKLLGFGNKLRVAIDWTLNFFYPRDTSEVEFS
ncbi:NAD(P)/FAD-dependent oxidoreductase [Candidatus Woesearchaeota archaeon]|nr:NAD(P)/FAD-dependent oxidoreductase [Candidatus Woesearchaeota archaeon]